MCVFLVLLLSQPVDSCIPTSPAAMPPIPCNSCPSLTVAAFASDTPSVDANYCSTRTLTCGSATSTSTLITYNGATSISGSGALTFVLTCSPGNTAWLYMGTRISQAECSEPCQTCPTLSAKGFATNDPSAVNGCLRRTLTCGSATSTNTLIKYNGATSITGSGTLNFVVTCNAANTAWIYMGTPISQAECTEPCQTCPTLSATGFATNDPSAVNGCLRRTLTCGSATSTNTLIKYNGATSITGSGTLNFVVTCNAANTAWLYMGTPISQAECSAPCQTCPAFTATGFATNVLSTASGCSVRTLTCGSATSTSTLIRYNGATDITGTGMLNFVVTCNSANTAWLYMGTPITQAECSYASIKPCQTCPAFTAIAFATDILAPGSNGCATRTLTCGRAASTKTLIKYNGATGINGSGKLTFAMTCNAANTAWLYMGIPISQAECSEPCQHCPTFPAIGFDKVYYTYGGCTIRKLECGKLFDTIPHILRFNGNVDFHSTGPGGYVFTGVVCNDANTAWTSGSLLITMAECIIP